MKKILYFEGAGCVPCNDVENCRIRTAFTNKEGKKIYIELLSGYKHIKIEYGKNGKKLEKPKMVSEDGFLYCDYCYYITEDPEIDDCNKSRLSCEHNPEMEKVKYTKENILAFVNENCNADFDEIVVLDNLAGFRVHNDSGKYNTSERYNYGDVFNYDADLTIRRKKKVKEMKKEFCALFNQQYDNTSYYIENNQLVVRIAVSDKVLKESGWTKGRKFIVEV
ncbi:MAG: hypothetical protein HDQ99_02520 [Lachnospiraceae bacterium]|nr:hypothetical protein [Lachnospiraceae bacterium]